MGIGERIRGVFNNPGYDQDAEVKALEEQRQQNAESVAAAEQVAREHAQTALSPDNPDPAATIAEAQDHVRAAMSGQNTESLQPSIESQAKGTVAGEVASNVEGGIVHQAPEGPESEQPQV